MYSRWKYLAALVNFCLVAFFMVLAVGASAARAATGSYNAELPPDLNTAKDMCALVPCAEVFPGAKSFSERMGQPPYVEAYGEHEDDRDDKKDKDKKAKKKDEAESHGEHESGKKKLLGYVMLSTDIPDMPAYSGKPVVTLIGMDLKGRFVGVKVLKHSEPILLLGIPESALLNFNQQYVGKSVADKIEVGQSRPDEGVLGVDAISGATVTVITQNQVMMTAGTAVARQVGILAPTVREPARFVASGKRLSWAQLVEQGRVQRLRVLPQDVGMERGSEPFVELWFGDISHPDIGASLLGENVWNNLRLQFKAGEHAIFIIRTKAFSAAYPWKLSFLGNRVDPATGKRSFATFDAKYWLPGELLQGGRPVVEEAAAPWVQVWKSRAVEIALFATLLIMVTVVYAFREKLTRLSTHKNKWPVNAFKYSAWALSIGFVGFGAMAQPSITQVLAWLHTLLFQWTWSLFLSDPFIFLFWIFIILTVFLYGRGLFCGWMCPFGSLSEDMYKLGGLIGLKRFQGHLPRVWHDRLKWVKYAVFLGLLTVSLFSLGLAEMLSEVEPFKTTFLVGISNRAWPYGLFVGAILGLSIFTERPYCKYICPLGAALAMPSTFRWFGLPRKQDCNSCKACAAGCGPQAIDAAGRIDHRECLHCLDCLVLYTDAKGCPPLARERKRREREGLEITPIGRDGYFIPIHPVPMDARVSQGPDPRMPTDPVPRPHKTQARFGRALWLELVDHLWPWSAEGWTSQRALQIAGFSLALAATVAWVLAATGQLSASAIIGWGGGRGGLEDLIC